MSGEPSGFSRAITAFAAAPAGDDDLAVGLKRHRLADVEAPEVDEASAAEGRVVRAVGVDAPHRDVPVRPQAGHDDLPVRLDGQRPGVSHALDAFACRRRRSRGPGRRGRRGRAPPRAPARRPRARASASAPASSHVLLGAQAEGAAAAEARPDEEPLARVEHHARVATEADDAGPQAQAHALRARGPPSKRPMSSRFRGGYGCSGRRGGASRAAAAVPAVAPRLAVADRDVRPAVAVEVGRHRRGERAREPPVEPGPPPGGAARLLPAGAR